MQASYPGNWQTEKMQVSLTHHNRVCFDLTRTGERCAVWYDL
jgi:hypothetical protein